MSLDLGLGIGQRLKNSDVVDTFITGCKVVHSAKGVLFTVPDTADFVGCFIVLWISESEGIFPIDRGNHPELPRESSTQ